MCNKIITHHMVADMKNRYKIILGVALSAFFLYLSLRKVDFGQMAEAFSRANYWYIVPAIVIVFLSHWLRAVRWKLLLYPIHVAATGRLYVALLLGYWANNFLPAHLGEFLRAYIISKKENISASSAFGTIVIERIIDVFTLLFLMAVTLIIFPFPAWVTKSGYITFAVSILLLLLLIFMKKYNKKSVAILKKLVKPISESLYEKILLLMDSFFQGITPLKDGVHYVYVSFLSILIWACYAYVFYLSFQAFNFIDQFSLPWSASLVLLVITTIAVLVPSSPGYIGTYHYLCMLSLAQFNVPDSAALTYAFFVHGINFLPLLLIGFILIPFEGLSLRQISKKPDIER
ncbi:flippase-like domain-containing protein [candidate division KSB1 bacterium]|nr:flippase-like domain-containing protein [candidate division KSB1 bacterium]